MDTLPHLPDAQIGAAMDRSEIAAGHDRLSSLGDVLLGHILSFLNAKEAARAAALSSRWRDVFAFVHTVSLELPERPIYACAWNEARCDHPQLQPFVAAVTAALFSRSRCPAPAAAAVPLRALRVSMERDVQNSTVDQWVSYALRHAASMFELDLRLEPGPICYGPDRFRFSDAVGRPSRGHAVAHPLRAQPADAARAGPDEQSPVSHLQGVNDEDDAASSDSEDEDEMPPRSDQYLSHTYTSPSGLFSCAALRSLRLGSYLLSPPAVISLPSLEVLHLTSVFNEDDDVQRLISACPRLVELTVESCGKLTVLLLLDNTRLRSLALRFCSKLTTVSVDASELRYFEYLGAVQDKTFLDVRGIFPSVTSCKIDICDVAKSWVDDQEEDNAKLGSFLQLFASTKHLFLGSLVMGWCFEDLPELATLRHLEINGCLPGKLNPADAIYMMSSILDQTPNLDVLTLFFEGVTQGSCGRNEGELLDVHHLHYNQYDYLADVSEGELPSCLGSRLTKINFVHYQGGRMQRTLARFLLTNSQVLEMLYCGFAEGPEWIQKELMREIEGWVMNETSRKEFH